MKRLLLSVCIPALTFFGFSLKAHAAETHSAPAVMNAEGEGIFPKGKTNDAYAQYFNGTSYLQALSTEGVAIANVTFEPGCRNFWHIHHKGGQILLVTGGRGWYQQWEKPALALKPGDVVTIPAGVKHWHGAKPNQAMQHIAIGERAENEQVQWLEKVSDEIYLQPIQAPSIK